MEWDGHAKVTEETIGVKWDSFYFVTYSHIIHIYIDIYCIVLFMFFIQKRKKYDLWYS